MTNTVVFIIGSQHTDHLAQVRIIGGNVLITINYADIRKIAF